MNLYLYRLREYANEEMLARIDADLQPPPTWVDPGTGLPAGFEDDDLDEWL